MTTIRTFYFSALLLLLNGCSKIDFLNTPPDLSLAVPSSLSEFQAILDQDALMNGASYSGWGPVPFAGEAGADDYYIDDDTYNAALIPQYQNYYSWANRIYAGFREYNWDSPYQSIFYANIVIDGLVVMVTGNVDQPLFNKLMGSALFYRAHAFYQLAQVFAPPYQEATASSKWGIPLRMHADIGENLTRDDLNKTYEEIISELIHSIPLLDNRPAIKTRPSKQAAYGLLARVFQTMQHYNEALLYADSCLQLQSDLMPYSQLDTSASYPFVGGLNKNPEVIFACNMLGISYGYPILPNYAMVDSNLYRQYDNGDLRKKLFFRNAASGHAFRGSYEASDVNFAGLAVDEILLIQAECLARKGSTEAAMDKLNQLLITRWDHRVFKPITAGTSQEALTVILQERRKELLFRGLRWTDLRRLNLEGGGIKLTRHINSKVYELLPNDPKYTYPIPDDIISFHPDMPQNLR